jgi:Protein of unknown function (DUF4240)
MTGMTERLLRFPKKFSMGGLYTAPLGQPETWDLLDTPLGLIVNPENQPINWQWLDEARGDVIIPDAESSKLQLKVSASAAGSLAPLENLPANSLHVLDLSRSQVPDLGLTHVSHLSSLRVLELAYTPVSDAGLAFIARLGELESLGLTATNISSDGLLHLSTLSHLKELWLNGTAVDDSGLENLGELGELKLLGLSGTKISDKGLVTLKSLKSLLRLYLFNTQVTEAGVAEIRAALPNVRVKWKRAIPTRPEFTLAELVDLSIKADKVEEQPAATIAAVMSEDDFWDLIDLLNWDEEGNDDAVIAPVVQHLSDLSESEILAFQEALAEKLWMLDGERFAREIGRDCYQGPDKAFSREWFLAARCCAVANGQDFFEDILLSPENMPKDLGFLALSTVAERAYRKKTGRSLTHKTRHDTETGTNLRNWSTHKEK